MSQIHAEVSKVIEAPPEAVYAVIADYNNCHPATLPKHIFSDLVVKQGSSPGRWPACVPACSQSGLSHTP